MRLYQSVFFSFFILLPFCVFAGNQTIYRGYTYQSDKDALLVINNQTGEVIKLSVGLRPGDLCIDHERKIGYIMSHGDQSVSLIDLETNTIIRTISETKNVPLKSESF